MMTLIPDMPEDVVAVSATGTITAEDYERVLIPAVDQAHQKFQKLKFLYYIGDEYTGFTAHAMWDDAKVGLKHLRHFSKVAVVSDSEFVRGAMKVVAFMMPYEVKLFSNAELDAATQWITQ